MSVGVCTAAACGPAGDAVPADEIVGCESRPLSPETAWMAVTSTLAAPFGVAARSIDDGGPKTITTLPRRVSEPFVSPEEKYLSAIAIRSLNIFSKSGPRLAL